MALWGVEGQGLAPCYTGRFYVKAWLRGGSGHSSAPPRRKGAANMQAWCMSKRVSRMAVLQKRKEYPEAKSLFYALGRC